MTIIQRFALVGFIVTALTACSGASTADDGTLDDETTGGLQCDLELRTLFDDAASTQISAAGQVTLKAQLINHSDADIALSLPDRCPSGSAAFSGLEDANGWYDYYGTCAAGACMDDLPPVELWAAGHLSRDVGAV